MIVIKRPAVATKGITITFALTTAVFLGLTIVHRTQTAQVAASVVSTASTPDDVIDVGSIGLAPSWECAGVPITFPCGGTQANPGLTSPRYPFTPR